MLTITKSTNKNYYRYLWNIAIFRVRHHQIFCLHSNTFSLRHLLIVWIKYKKQYNTSFYYMFACEDLEAEINKVSLSINVGAPY